MSRIIHPNPVVNITSAIFAIVASVAIIAIVMAFKPADTTTIAPGTDTTITQSTTK